MPRPRCPQTITGSYAGLPCVAGVAKRAAGGEGKTRVDTIRAGLMLDD